MSCPGEAAGQSPANRVTVGLALKKEKRKKHISDRLVQQAAEAGITLQFIDKEAPLEGQGPFVAILQKVRKPEWERELVEYAARHPETQVFDLPAATYPLRNRGSMVSFLDGDGWCFEEPAALVPPGRRPQRCRCNVPTNTTLAEGVGFEAAAAQMQASGLSFPVLAKPLWADGREGSHALAVVHTPAGLARLLAGEVRYLRLPVMLQQYVDHGGCLFKVYVLGDTSVRVKRNSLHLPPWTWVTPPPPGVGGGGGGEGAQQQQQQQPQAPAPGPAKGAVEALLGQDGRPDLEMMERVSAYPASKSWGRADTAPKGHGVPSPPAWLLHALAQRLRRKTGLSLFNFDVIVPMHLHRRRLPHGTSAGEAAPSGGASQARLNGGSSGGANAFAAAAAQAVAEVECAAQHAAAAAAAEEPVAMELSAAGPSAAAEAAVVEPPQAAAAAPPGGQAQQQQAQQADQQQAQGGQQTGAAANTAEAGAAGAGAAAAAAGGEEEPGELLYHLIDINYFPGYEKMPDYEHYMVQFLRSVCFPQPQPQAPQEQPAQQQRVAAAAPQ